MATVRGGAGWEVVGGRSKAGGWRRWCLPCPCRIVPAAGVAVRADSRASPVGGAVSRFGMSLSSCAVPEAWRSVLSGTSGPHGLAGLGRALQHGVDLLHTLSAERAECE